MKAKNIWGETVEQVQAKYAKAVADGFAPTLAIIFCSVRQNRKALVDFFSSKGVDVFGATTAGEIIDDEVMEYTAAVMLLDMKKENYAIFTEEGANTYQLSEALARFAKQRFNNPSIIVISSGLAIDAEQIISGVKDVDAGLPLYGGLAGDDITMTSSYVFSSGYDSSNGLIGLVLNGDAVNVQGIATSGWDDIGIEKTITKSAGNVVYTIDDEPAVDVFVKFFKFTDSVDNSAEIIATNFAQYPLQLHKENGNVVLRSPLLVDMESKALIFAGGLPEGSKVKFSVPPGFDIVEKTAEHIKVLLKEKIADADALLMFSCTGRRLAFGPMTADEAGLVRNIWNKPLLGFFTYGEIGCTQDSTCDFHNETCSMVVMEERA